MDFPYLLPVFLNPFGIDIHHDTLAAEPACSLTHELWALACRGVDGDLVATGIQECADVLDSADAPPHSQRHEHHICGTPNHVNDDIPFLVAGGNVKKN